MHRVPRRGLAVCALFATLMASQAQAVTSSQLGISGQVALASTLNLADLQALPALEQTVTFLLGTTPQTHTYIGVGMWDLLNRPDGKGILVNPAVKNDILGKYVLATGTDGYNVVYSAGELDPSFGNRAALVAYAEKNNGVTTPLGSDGFARTTAPGDVKGGRYVSNLASLSVQTSTSTAVGTGGGLSTKFTVTGDVLKAKTFDLAALSALPAVTRTANGSSYTGASFWDVLTNVGLAIDPAVKNDLLGMYVVATGNDGYKTLFSLGELSPDFGNQPDLIAYDPAGGSLSGNGFARVVVPNDVKAGRYVSNLVSLEVFHAVTPVPEPASMAMMAIGLVGMAWRIGSAGRAHACSKP